MFSEWEDACFRKVLTGPYLFKAQGPRIIENFLDVGHFPFVHAGFLGDPGHTEVGDYEVETTSDGIVARDIGVWQPDPDGTGQAAEVKYNYRVLRPLTAYFQKSYQDQKFSIFSAVTPVDDRESLAWLILALNYAPQTSDEQLRAFPGCGQPAGHSRRRVPAPRTSSLGFAGRIAFAFRSHGDCLPEVAGENRFEVRYRVSAANSLEGFPRATPARWFVPGDLDGFFGLFFSGFPDLLLIAGLAPLCGFPMELVAGRILPAVAFSILAGNLFYAWQAHRLSEQSGRMTSPRFPSASILLRSSRMCF